MPRFFKTTAALSLGPAAAFLFFGCAGNHPPPNGGAGVGVPVIVSLSPARGRTGEDYPIEVTMVGTGFAEAGNIVTFGGIPSEGLPSTDGGTRLTFWIPKVMPGPGEAPPMVLDPGDYGVTVTTPHGTSEPFIFTLTRGA